MAVVPLRVLAVLAIVDELLNHLFVVGSVGAERHRGLILARVGSVLGTILFHAVCFWTIRFWSIARRLGSVLGLVVAGLVVTRAVSGLRRLRVGVRIARRLLIGWTVSPAIGSRLAVLAGGLVLRGLCVVARHRVAIGRFVRHRITRRIVGCGLLLRRLTGASFVVLVLLRLGHALVALLLIFSQLFFRGLVADRLDDRHLESRRVPAIGTRLLVVEGFDPELDHVARVQREAVQCEIMFEQHARLLGVGE